MKKLSGVLGFLMLLAIPTEEALKDSFWKAMAVWAGWVVAGILLLAYSGAFKQKQVTSKISKS